MITEVNIGMMNECNRQLILFWAKQIDDFMREEGFQIDPVPSIVIMGADEQKNDMNDVLISTGGYQPQLKQITLMVNNRHIKDVLRSYCHEMVHHHQNLDNPDYLCRVMLRSDDVYNSPELEEIEGEAYLKGNLLFRKFTEKLKKKLSKKDK